MSQRKIGIMLGLSIVGIMFTWLIVTISNLAAESRTVYLRNPYDKQLKVQIGDNTYRLTPRSIEKIEIQEGEIDIKSSLSGVTIVDTSVYISPEFVDGGGVINVTAQSMYLWYEVYGSPQLENIYRLGDSTSAASSPVQQKISQSSEYHQIDSIILYGIMKEFPKNQILIKKEWDYNFNDSFENEVSTSSSTGAVLGESRSKIFDKKGMLEYWESNYARYYRQIQLMDSLNYDSDTIN
ncbi:MAG: hypothetical protein Crog4KO_07120 [Crocinitomicaceae bacterium]